MKITNQYIKNIVRKLTKNEKKIQKNRLRVEQFENSIITADVENASSKNRSVIKIRVLVPKITNFHLRNRSISGILPLVVLGLLLFL